MPMLKKIIFHALLGGLMVISILVLLELFSRAIFSLSPSHDKSAFEQRLLATQTRAEALAERKDLRHTVAAQHVIHPYLGFVRNSELKKPQLNFIPVNEPVNEFGFFGSPPLKAHEIPEDTVVIAIAGGSVAAELYLYSREALGEALNGSAEFSGKRLYFVSLALGGMKQPQQLLALSYFIALGYHFDALINLDGFNEVVLPLAENKKAGVYPPFPRKWHLYSARALSPSAAATLATIVANRERLTYWQGLVSNSILRRSHFVLLSYGLYHQNAQLELTRLETALQSTYTPGQLDFQQRGPAADPDSAQTMADAIALWSQASLTLSRACRAAGIRYYHFLQPNQYVVGSKPLSEQEIESAILPPSHDYRKFAELGYAGLRRHGSALQEAGVAYFDLTNIFSEQAQTLYKDSCCHLNQEGSDMLAREIGATIRDHPKSAAPTANF